MRLLFSETWKCLDLNPLSVEYTKRASIACHTENTNFVSAQTTFYTWKMIRPLFTGITIYRLKICDAGEKTHFEVWWSSNNKASRSRATPIFWVQGSKSCCSMQRLSETQVWLTWLIFGLLNRCQSRSNRFTWSIEWTWNLLDWWLWYSCESCAWSLSAQITSTSIDNISYLTSIYNIPYLSELALFLWSFLTDSNFSVKQRAVDPMFIWFPNKLLPYNDHHLEYLSLNELIVHLHIKLIELCGVLFCCKHYFMNTVIRYNAITNERRYSIEVDSEFYCYKQCSTNQGSLVLPVKGDRAIDKTQAWCSDCIFAKAHKSDEFAHQNHSPKNEWHASSDKFGIEVLRGSWW